MSTEAWILFATLIILLGVVTTQFSRLVLHLLRMHREERAENNDANRKVITSLEAAIREAGGITNIFNADKQQNQIGDENEQG